MTSNEKKKEIIVLYITPFLSLNKYIYISLEMLD